MLVVLEHYVKRGANKNNRISCVDRNKIELKQYFPEFFVIRN